MKRCCILVDFECTILELCCPELVEGDVRDSPAGRNSISLSKSVVLAF